MPSSTDYPITIFAMITMSFALKYQTQTPPTMFRTQQNVEKCVPSEKKGLTLFLLAARGFFDKFISAGGPLNPPHM